MTVDATDRPVSVLDRGRTSPNDPVVLLDAQGRPSGYVPKGIVHGPGTPLHLAISCYVVDGLGRLLLTRRAITKRTFPGVWTNACCGHPRPEEPLEHAVRRHLFDELRLTPARLALALPDFAYRAAMENGCVEHELCPVFIAEVDAEPVPDPQEADDFVWLTWAELCARADDAGSDLSPWSRTQISRLLGITDDPLDWVRRHASSAARPRRVRPQLPATDDRFPTICAQVDEVVDRFVAAATDLLHDLDPLATELVDPIRELFTAGGKRLRPCLVFAGHEASGGRHTEAGDDVIDVAAAVEMLHTFALLHDDVMDRSALRRGRPTAHLRFAELHRERDAGGDSDWFGSAAAVVAGDLAFVWADQLLDRLTCDPLRRQQVRAVFSTLRSEVIAGQYLDLRLAGPWASDEQAQTIALLKSGRYTVTRPLELGAVLAGANRDTLQALRRFGDSIGVAFQLRDDVLGVFGAPDVTGKSACEDIRSGKASLLLVRALELAPPARRDVLRAGLGCADLSDDDVDRCRDIVSGSGALASIEALIAAKLTEAEAALDGLDDHAAAPLLRLSHMLVERVA